jgi:hypothetical protein
MTLHDLVGKRLLICVPDTSRYNNGTFYATLREVIPSVQNCILVLENVTYRNYTGNSNGILVVDPDVILFLNFAYVVSITVAKENIDDCSKVDSEG